MKAIAKIDCQVNGIYYKKGDEIEVRTTEGLNKLNEIGFIEPLTANQIQNFEKTEFKKIIRKEEV